jgi:dienelactone hydrolase
MAVDVLSAVRWLRGTGVTSVAVIGGSAGGGAAAQASVDAVSGEIDRIVLLAPMSIDAPERMKGRKLFVASRDDLGPDDKPRLPIIQDQYTRARDPKQFVILDGADHGQRIFAGPQGDRLMREILRFLSER